MIMANWNSGSKMRKSVNSGLAFTYMDPAFDPRDCFVSKDGNYMYAMLEFSSTLFDGIYKSTDKGVTWAYKVADPARKTFHLRVYASTDGRYVSLTTQTSSSPYTGYLYTSSDFGETWTKHTEIGLKLWYNCHVSASGQYMTATNYATSKVYISNDYGATFTLTSNMTARVYNYAGISGDGKYILSTSYNTTIITKSSDYGVTFTDQTLANTRNFSCCDLSYDGKYQFALTLTGSTVLRSADYGATWTEISTAGGNGYSLSCSSCGKYVIIGSSSTSYLSNDYGVTFLLIANSGSARGVSIEKTKI
jgi:photosystem II stability/assembly factor-like uncharacterized protein